MRQHQQFLSAIEQQLSMIPPRGLSSIWLNDEFGRCYQRYESLTNQMEIIADFLAESIRERVERAPQTQPFRICSLACGDGVMDKMVLERLLRTLPAERYEFLGIEINEDLCRAEEECLAALPVTTKIRCMDLNQMTPADAPDMDFVYMVHGHYYTPDFDTQLDNILSIRGPNTTLQIVSAQDAVYNQLYLRFWRHELGRTWWLSDHLIAALRKREIEPTVQNIMARLDITRCFDEGPTSPFARDFLDFLCHVPLAAYPEGLQQLCISWLQEAANHSEGRYLLEHPCLFLTIE